VPGAAGRSARVAGGPARDELVVRSAAIPIRLPRPRYSARRLTASAVAHLAWGGVLMDSHGGNGLLGANSPERPRNKEPDTRSP